MIRVTRHDVALRGLPPGAEGCRIAHLTDFHRGRMTSDALLEHAVRLANEQQPDLIVLTGDYVTRDSRDIEPAASIIGRLRANLGVFASLGNHDYSAGGEAVAAALTRNGAGVLRNQSILLENGLRLVGIDDDRFGHADVARSLKGVRPDEASVILAHNPALMEQLGQVAALILSGHTHGGQIRMPILTERQVRRIGAKHYRAGWFTFGRARCYVNQGLGNVGLPIRIGCRPEVAIFSLRRALEAP